MFPILWKAISWLLWGPRKRVNPAEPIPLNVGSSDGYGWTYGDVVTKVYLNRNHRGQPYFKVKFVRLVKDERIASQSFFMSDLKDIEMGIARVRAWVHDSKIT